MAVDDSIKAIVFQRAGFVQIILWSTTTSNVKEQVQSNKKRQKLNVIVWSHYVWLENLVMENVVHCESVIKE